MRPVGSDLSIRSRGLLMGIGLLVAMIVVNASIDFRQTRELHDESAQVIRTQDIIAALDDVVSAVKDAETGQRGYLITGDATYLKPYTDALATTDQTIERFKRLTADNPLQQDRVPRLRKLIAAKLQSMARTIELRKDENFAAARDRVLRGEGKEVMDEIRKLIAQMEADEQQLLASREAANHVAYRSALQGCIFSAVLGLIAVAAFVWLLRRHLVDHAKSAAAVQEQRDLLRATLISIGDAVIATDAHGRVTFLNTVASNLTGWTQEDAHGQPLTNVLRIVNEETRENVENPALRALTEGRIVGLANHTVLISKDGTEWPIDDSAAPITSAAGEVRGAILVFREIQQRKRHQDEMLRQAAALKEADRRKDEFLATLAHELRNPLSPISNALQLWPLIENDRGEVEQLRLMMERQVRQMTRLIDDLMDVSRITRGKIQLRQQLVDLATVVSGAVEAVQPMMESCGHHLTVAMPPGPLFVRGDVARLTQVFGNILHNAAKYSGHKGEICVDARRQDGQALVSVRDNGPGIPRHMLSEIFEMFRQVDGTLHRSYGGLGIGLTLVKQLVELHGGTIAAHSDGPGKGSEFIVALPVLAPDAAMQQACGSARPSLPANGMPRHRILVVDDLEASAKTLAMMLRSLGQDVSLAFDGRSAVEWAQANQPRIVFLDIGMPGMDGYEVARRIREQTDSGHVVLVALTGYGQEEDRRQAFEAGFNHHLTKPANIAAIEQLICTTPPVDAESPAGQTQPSS